MRRPGDKDWSLGRCLKASGGRHYDVEVDGQGGLSVSSQSFVRATPETAPTEERELPRDGSLDDQNTPVTPVQRPPAIGRNPIETRDHSNRRARRCSKTLHQEPKGTKPDEGIRDWQIVCLFFVEEERMWRFTVKKRVNKVNEAYRYIAVYLAPFPLVVCCL